MEHVARQAFGVNSHQHVLRVPHLTLDERDMVLAVEHRAVADGHEVPERRGQPGGDHPFDELLGPPPVGDEVGHRDHLQPMAGAVLGQVGYPRHRPVVVHDLTDHAGGDEARQPRQVNRRLRLSDALERSSGLGLQREHVSGLHQLPRAGLRVYRHLNGARAVRCGDAGADAGTRLDGDGERRLERRFVLGGHEVETELLAALGCQRKADQPPPLLGHEVDGLGRHELGGHRQIALVLAILVVADHHHLALADVLDRLLDRREWALHRCHRAVPPGIGTGSRGPISRSTYFASTSTSRLTVMPGSACPRFVRSSVSGINETVNDRSSRSATVSDTPSTVIDPLYTMYLSSSRPVSIVRRREKPSSATAETVPIPSTWPWTM